MNQQEPAGWCSFTVTHIALEDTAIRKLGLPPSLYPLWILDPVFHFIVKVADEASNLLEGWPCCGRVLVRIA